MTLIVGVDPGATGALALLRANGSKKTIEVVDMPVGKITVGKSTRNRISPELLGDVVADWAPFVDVAYIEEVAAMPKQGVSSVFTFGQAHGMVLGAFATHGVRIVRIRPLLWQNTVKGRGDPRMRALELYPEMKDHLKRKKDEGRADAMLIAHAGWMLEQ